MRLHYNQYASPAAILAFIAAMRPIDAPSGPPPRSPVGPPAHTHPADASAAVDEAAVAVASRPNAATDALLLRGLFLAPHAPLRFMSAQALWALAPLAALLGVKDLPRWAAALESPSASGPHTAD